MSASYATSPAAFVITSNNPQDNISAEPAGDFLKLVVIIMAEDADAWAISTMQVGGRNATTIFAAVDTSEATQESRIRAFEWDQTDIDLMSGVAITYADGSFINPMAITHYWVENCDQDPSTQTSDTIITTDSLSALTIAAVSVAGDLVVGAVVASDDIWDVNDWDTLSEDRKDVSDTNISLDIGSSVVTNDTSHLIDLNGTNVRAAGIILVHKQLLAGGKESVGRGVGRGIGRGIM